MAGSRSYALPRAVINGFSVMGGVESYTPPSVSFIMEEVKGGRFVAGEMAVGIEAMKGKIVLSDVTDELLLSMGVELDEFSEITVLSSSIDEDKVKKKLRWEHTCDITKIDTGEVKPGKMQATLEFTCRVFKHMDNGKVIHNINTKTQETVVFGVDRMAQHRANVELA